METTMAAAARKGKWHTPAAAAAPPSTPRILHLPLRSRISRRLPPPSARPERLERGIKLVSFFEQEGRSSGGGAVGRRAESGEFGGERWRFQAEVLRAECNFLRMEREIASKKLESNRAQMETALRSAVQTLVSGRKKIDGSGGMGIALEEEIEDLEEKLDELGRGDGGCDKVDRVDLRRRRGRRDARNFDRQASSLRRRLERMGDETPSSIGDIKEIQESRQKEEPATSNPIPQLPDVDMLKRKMEGISRGMLERVEEFGEILIAKSEELRPGGGRRNSCDHQEHQAAAEKEKPTSVGLMLGSCTYCKEVVGRIVEQARMETEQWTEMQSMLEQVRREMEELQSSRDLWKRRAMASDLSLRSLQCQMVEWKLRARASDRKVKDLQKQVSELQLELRKIKLDSPSPASRTYLETWNSDAPKNKSKQQTPQESHKEKEKHVLVCQLKKSQAKFPGRLPLQDISNSAWFQA